MNRDADAAISVAALTKRYAGGIVALNGIDLGIARGTVTAIVGANGSGKSTLLKILAGLTPADEGSIRVLGADPAQRPATLRARTGYAAQGVELDPEMTGDETLRLFATLHGIAPHEIPTRIAELTATLALGSISLVSWAPIRAACGNACTSPSVSSTNRSWSCWTSPPRRSTPRAGAAVWQLVQHRRDQGRTLVLTTHDTIDASRHCETVVLLHRGRVAATGAPHGLVARHGNWTLEMQLTRSLADGHALPEPIASSIASMRPVVRGDRLILRFVETDAAAALGTRSVVIGRLEAAGETVLGFRLDPPDLASAYFNLTAEAIEKPENPVPRPGAGSGREEHRLVKGTGGK